MKPGAKELSMRPSRDSMSIARSQAGNVSQLRDSDASVCDDDDLGAEWTGNLDCYGNSKVKQKGRKR